MQRVPLVILYGLDYRKPIQWPLERRREGREREREESVLLIRMSRFVFIIIAILRTRFVSNSTVIIKPFANKCT